MTHQPPHTPKHVHPPHPSSIDYQFHQLQPHPIYTMQEQYPNPRPQSPVKKSEWWIAFLLILGSIAAAVVCINLDSLLGAIVCGVVFVLTLGYILFRNSLLDNCFCVCCCDITPCVECCCDAFSDIPLGV